MVHLFTILGANYKLQNQIESKQSASAESEAKILQLTKEKDELLELAMSRGKIIQVHHNLLTHSRMNRLSHTIYWKSPISILGTFGHEILIFL